MSPVEGSVAERLSESLRAGVRLDLLSDSPPTDHGLLPLEVMEGWGPAQVVEAGLIRDLLRGRIVTDPDPHGIRIRGARILGRLDLELVTTGIGLELSDCLLEDGIDAVDAQLAGLWLHRCRISSAGEPAFAGSGLQVRTLVSFASSVITANSVEGAVHVESARFARELSFGAAVVRNGRGPALGAVDLQTGGDLFLDDGFLGESAGSVAVDLSGAHIGGVLDCRTAVLRSSTSDALRAERITVTGTALLDELDASGGVRLADAAIGGRLDLPAATVTSSRDAAVVLDRVAVAGNVYLNRSFRARGVGPGGAVRLVGARIEGRLNCRAATIGNPAGPALVADGMQVHGDALIDDGFTVSGVGPRGTLRLENARIDGELRCVGAQVANETDGTHRWRVEGLTYRGVPKIDPEDNHRTAWLAMLRSATHAYAAQPYQQLAAAFRAEGHDGDVRAILMQQRRDQLERGALTRVSDRVWARATGVLLGYGYQPWRALAYLAGVVLLSIVLAFGLGNLGGLDRPSDQTVSDSAAHIPRTSCTVVQTIGIGADLGTPFLPARSGNRACEITGSAAGDLLTIARWILQLAAWALAALFITGFTGIVRKT